MSTLLAARYRLETKVAGGGMGEVWRATDVLLERRVAVKLLRSSLAEDPVVAERFRREALLAASLSHPNMAGVYDYVQENGRPGIVMEFVEGETLAERIARSKRMTVPEAVGVASAVLAALQKAHDAGIVHRDVKPPNVILTPAGDVKVTDFGIARATGDQTLTETGMVVGTAHYLSPEQANGTPATPASDIYAVGAILYEMLTGARPFEAETPLAVAMRRLTDDPAPLRTHRRGVPAAVEGVVMKALSRDPSRRFASAHAMRVALDAALGGSAPETARGLVVAAHDATPTDLVAGPEHSPPLAKADATEVLPLGELEPVVSGPPPRRRRRRIGTALAVLAALLAVGLAIYLVRVTGKSPTVKVPDFRNLSLASAAALADRYDLRIETREVESTAPQGTVLSQDVPKETEVRRAQLVTLTVSSGVPPRPAGVQVPDLHGLDREEAEEALVGAGLRLGGQTTEESTEVDPGTVIRSSPGAGQTVEPGSTVDIVIAVEARGRRKKGND